MPERRIPKRTKDIRGQKFNLLTVVEIAERIGDVYWVCVCDCGTVCQTRGVDIRRGQAKSCGCLKSRKTHGLTGTVEYRAWYHMKQRCTMPNHCRWEHYGGRGIKVCDEWITSFEAFLSHVGPKPGPGYSLDRIDNDGNYEPGNVRWATASEQANNKRWSGPRRKALV